MSGPKPDIFRQASLERLASPEKLDQLMTVVRPRHWVPLAVLAGLVSVLAGWACFGRLPVNVVGRGVFVDPTAALGAQAQVVALEAPGAGTLLKLEARRGEMLKKGAVIGLVDRPELRAQLKGERARLAGLLAHDAALGGVEREKATLDDKAIAERRAGIEKNLAQAEALAPLLKEKSLAAVKAERQAVEEQLSRALPLVGTLEETLAARQRLKDQGLIADAVYLAAQRDAHEAREQVGRLRTQLRELEAKEAEVQRAYHASLDQISALQAQLRELDVKSRSGRIEELQAQTTREAAIADSRRRIAQLEAELREQSEIRAAVDGRVLEVAAVVGQLVTLGERLGTIQQDAGPESDDTTLASVAYFTIGEGKRIKPGMRVQVTPDTVTREEYGGIAGTVKRVSELPVSQAGVINVVNNAEVAQSLMAGGRTIEVFMTLERDATTPSGYRWTGSRGPELTLSSGTTQTVRVTLDERAPLSYLLPMLRSAGGL